MSTTSEDAAESALAVVRAQLDEAVRARKCHHCGCLHQTVAALEGTTAGRGALASDLARARGVFAAKKYDCLGCAVCFPAIAANAFSEAMPEEGQALDLCPTEPPVEQVGWPPLPGDYRVVRPDGRVAVCTLNSTELMEQLAADPPIDLAIVGTLHTENLGIERLIRNLLGNSRIRSLVVCGVDTQQAVGHLPGQSLVSLFAQGLDEAGRIVGARGKRPVLKNVSREQVAAFVAQVQLLPMIGETDPKLIGEAIVRAAAAAPTGLLPVIEDGIAPVVRATEPERLVSDPAGYCVVYPDSRRRVLRLEHFRKDGVLDCTLEGSTPAAVYATTIARGLISRLDHAAYLGRELARAERSLTTGEPYVQDRAPGESEPATTACGCSTPREGEEGSCRTG